MGMTLDGSNGITLPNGDTLTNGGVLLNIQYFTTPGSSTYTPTTGTKSVIVEVVGGGGGGSSAGSTAGNGGTSSFGALVSATGGTGGASWNTAQTPGSGSGGDLNVTGSIGFSISGSNARFAGGYSYLGFIGSGGLAQVTSTTNGQSGSGGGYARKKITSSFSGVTVTVGSGGTNAGSSAGVGNTGIVIVYEYA